MSMSKRFFPYVVGYSILFVGICSPAASQPSRVDSSSTRIEISTSVEKTQVPLNRTMKLFVILSWIGDPDRYSIVDFDNPALTNFDIVGTATVNRSEVIDNQTHVYKEYVYTLKPRELGMSYVEGVIVKCRDTVLNREENLVSQRISVETVDPLPDPKEATPIWQYAIPALVLLALTGSVLLWLRRRRRAAEEIEIPQGPPLEEAYLQNLGSDINLEHPNLNDDFATLSRLLRRYLTEKFQIRVLEGTTEDLVLELGEIDLEDHQVSSIRELLTRCDEIKFSGMEGTREELNRFYTLFEGLLQFSLRKRETIESAGEQESEN
ncbi:MAG: hypothetical protein V3U73_08280 [bacterium]